MVAGVTVSEEMLTEGVMSVMMGVTTRSADDTTSDDDEAVVDDDVDSTLNAKLAVVPSCVGV